MRCVLFSALSLLTISESELKWKLRTQAIQYLTASYQPMHRQSEASISKLVKDLAPYELTKAEKLQIVNLTPTEPVELYVVHVSCISLPPFRILLASIKIVEEIEDRLGDRMNEVLDVVRNSLSGPSNADVPDPVHRQQAADWNEGDTLYDDDRPEWEDGADAGAEEELFDDMGEGAGIEGDLEMDDD